MTTGESEVGSGDDGREEYGSGLVQIKGVER